MVCIRCPRKILGITWMDKVSNQDVLCRENLPGVEALIIKAHLRWSGHVMRMGDSRKSSVPNWPLTNASKGASENVTRTA